MNFLQSLDILRGTMQFDIEEQLNSFEQDVLSNVMKKLGIDLATDWSGSAALIGCTEACGKNVFVLAVACEDPFGSHSVKVLVPVNSEDASNIIIL